MIKTLSEIAKYSKLLFAGVILFIALQLYFTLQFVRVSNYVDHGKPLPYTIAFESFPFVVYNMYSGKIDDWNHYPYLRFEVDGVQMPLSGLPIFESEQILNPTDKYLMYEPANFNEEPLHSLLLHQFDSSALANKIYDKVSNHGVENMHDKWGRWLTWYIGSIKHKEVHTIKIFSCLYQYTNAGQPEKIEEKQVYQYP